MSPVMSYRKGKPGFYLHHGNSAEKLTEVFAKLMDEDPLPALETETIVIQNIAMRHYLGLELALRSSIAANLKFQFPGAMVRGFLKQITDLPYPFELDTLSWKLMKNIPPLLPGPEFSALRFYLEKDSRENRSLRLYQISRQIADAFDRYAVHGGEMIRTWSGDSPQVEDRHKWQAILWKSCISEEENPLYQTEKLLEYIRSSSFELPHRITLFGLFSLPPLFARVFSALAEKTEIHSFFLSPSPSFFGEKTPFPFVERRMEYHFYHTIHAFGPRHIVEKHHFVPPSDPTLLGALKRKLYGAENPQLPEERESLQIHSCHSPFREIEVLRDRLLSILENNPDLRTDDIAVLTPDIGLYAPIIRAVFGSGEDGIEWKFNIADSLPSDDAAALDALKSLFSVIYTRYSAKSVVQILEYEGTLRARRISREGLETIKEWILSAGIFAGTNTDASQESSLTWEAGLNRLLLGYMMAPGSDSFAQVLPVEGIEGTQAELAGNFIEFIHALIDISLSLRNRRTPEEWAQILESVCRDFLGETEASAPGLFSALRRARTLQPIYGEPIDPDTILSFLTDMSGKMKSGRSFMNGGITFCALVPMRSVPFRVLCMVGMNEASFPASESQAEFNILKNKGQADRTVEDRHLFLESLLCAGDYLHISYTGENAEGPPRSACSPVVELLKNMDSIFGSDLRRPVSESILIRHRMQSFHPDYFREDRTLYSYSRAGFRAAAAFLKPNKKNRPFLSKQLASFQEEAIQISSIISYYKYPSRTFLRQALGVDYFEDAELPDEEINLADGLTGFRLKEKALQFVLKGKKTDEIIENLLNSGLIFASSAGRFQIRRLLYETDSFFRTAAAIFENKSGEFSPESLHLKQFYRPVRGSLRFASPAAHVYIRPGSLSARFLLEAWVLHLAASLHFKNPNLTTLLCGTQSKEGFNLGLFRLASSIDAKSEFEYLLEFRKIGLVRPAPFFPLISLRFAEAQNDEARKKALVVLENDIGEEEELLFPDIAEELHGEEFQNISRRIFGPLLKSLHRDLEFDSIAEIIGGRKDVR